MDIFPTPPDSRPIHDKIYQLFDDYRYEWDLNVKDVQGNVIIIKVAVLIFVDTYLHCSGLHCS